MSATTISPLPAVLPHHRISPLNPNPNQYAAQPLKSAASYPGAGTGTATATTTTRTHLSNLDQLLQKQSPQPPLQNGDPDPHIPRRGSGGGGYSGLFNALNLPVKFPSARSAAEEMMSPRSLTHLQRLLSDPRPSPRNTIAPRWRSFHGASNWHGLLDPLDENLRRELVRYGDLVQSAYHAFHSSPAVRPDRHHSVVLPDRSYRVTRSLYATSSIDLPRWVNAGVPDWMTQRSSWIGYVAVCDNDREIHRMGRRDIVIALRGTATCLEWAENFRANLVPIDGEEDQGTKSSAAAAEKVECGFRSLYKTPGAEVPSLSSAVVDEVRRLVERYKGEELSITVTGHSLGAALSVLVAEELSRAVPEPPPIAVFSFGGPRVGNRGFADRVERSGVKVLRVVNAHDVVTRVPGVLPQAPPRKERGAAAEGKKGGWWPAKMLEGIDGYADVGTELRVDSRVSPYLRPDADPACCHDLEAYLHLVDGFLGTHCPFRSNAKRGLSRLMSQQGSNVKKLYMTKAKSLVVDPNSCRLDGGRSSYGNYLTSPS